jgi:hypothetical protein
VAVLSNRCFYIKTAACVSPTQHIKEGGNYNKKKQEHIQGKRRNLQRKTNQPTQKKIKIAHIHDVYTRHE